MKQGCSHGHYTVPIYLRAASAALTLTPHPLPTSTPTPHLGAPPPQYSWAKDNVPLAGSTAFDISVPRELRITNVQVVHNGTYRCAIQNKIGERLIGARSTTAQLFVISTSLVLVQL